MVRACISARQSAKQQSSPRVKVQILFCKSEQSAPAVVVPSVADVSLACFVTVLDFYVVIKGTVQGMKKKIVDL